jgi:2'-5' RNA ligase
MIVHRYFFAILPPESISAWIYRRGKATRKQYELAGRVIAPERLHISLHLAESSEQEATPERLEQLSALASSVRFPAFDVVLDRALSFRGGDSHPFVLVGGAGLEELRSFHRMLGAALGLGTARFTPHLTVLYDKILIPEHPIMPVMWKACEFALVHSYAGLSRHVIIDRWPLTKDQ